MESKFGYQLSEQAKADFEDIVSYIAAELSNPKAATDFADRLVKAIDEVRTFPESGSLVINEFFDSQKCQKEKGGKLYFEI